MAQQTEKIMFSLSEQLRDALGEFATKNSLSIAEVIRTAVAEHIEYDLNGEETAPRRGNKYATADERKLAQKGRAKEKRQLVASLIAAARKQDHEAAIKALEESVARLDAALKKPTPAAEPNVTEEKPAEETKPARKSSK
jgi:hypothetical protein